MKKIILQNNKNIVNQFLYLYVVFFYIYVSSFFCHRILLLRSIMLSKISESLMLTNLLYTLISFVNVT